MKKKDERKLLGLEVCRQQGVYVEEEVEDTV